MLFLRRGHRRSWLIALCLTANLTAAAPAAAQSASGSTAITTPLSIVHDHDNAVLNPGDPDFVVGDLPTRLRLPVFTDTYWPPHWFAGNVRSDTVGLQSIGARDSLRNGAIIGTVIGAAAFGALAAVLCNAYQAKGDDSCLPDTLRFAAIGGAIGAGAGLAIDAARSHRGVTVRIAIRF